MIDGKHQWPMWSTDEKSLNFARDTAGIENVWMHAITRGTPRQLPDFRDGRVLWSSISMDGAAIVFDRGFGIWRNDVASDAGRDVPITLRGTNAVADAGRAALTGGAREVVLSPDGKKVALVVRGVSV